MSFMGVLKAFYTDFSLFGCCIEGSVGPVVATEPILSTRYEARHGRLIGFCVKTATPRGFVRFNEAFILAALASLLPFGQLRQLGLVQKQTLAVVTC